MPDRSPDARLLHIVPARPATFPTPLTGFIGREPEIATIADLLTRARLLTLAGPGGSGKTRLAIESTLRVLDRFTDGAAWVELASLNDPALVPQTIAGALGLRRQPGGDTLGAVGASLQSRRLLLVLDNCEHLVGGCAQAVRALLQQAPALRILATSREPLHTAGEVVWRVPPLHLPDENAQGAAIAHGEAVQLFVERAQAVVPDFLLTDENASAVARICRRLEGIPLAIELAAARTQLLTPAQIALRLDDAFRLLTLGDREASPRQQTLRGAMDWSYDLLPSLERRLFARLSLFAGGFTLDAAESVCAGDGIDGRLVLDALTQLVDRSLVVVTEEAGEARCRLLEIVRQYAAEKLEGEGGCATGARRHAEYYLHLAETLEVGLTAPRQGASMDRLEAEHDNLRAALRWLVDRGDASAGCRLAGAIWRFWQTRGYLGEGRRWLREVLALRPADSAGESERAEWRTARPKALQGAGVLAWAQGDYEESRQLFEESLALYEVAGEDEGTAALRNNLGVIALHRAEYERAAELFESSLLLRRRQGNQWGIATLLNNLGATAGKQGDLVRARRYYEEALALQREVGNTHGTAISLSNLGATVYEQGDFPSAARLFEEGLALRRLLGDRTGVADSLGKLGRVALRQKEFAQARSLYGESLALLRELDDKERIAGALMAAAALSLAQREGERAVRLTGAAEGIREEIGAPLTAEERVEQERCVTTARGLMEEAAFDALWREGRALDVPSALELAEEELAVPAGALPPDTSTTRDAPGIEPAVAASSPTADPEAHPEPPPAVEGRAPELRILAMGALEVWRGEAPISPGEWGSAKPRELLFYLLGHRQGRTKEQIGLALWPEASPAQLRNSFHVTLHHLRRALGDPGWIVFENDRYRFDRSLPYEYDVERFESHLAEAERLGRLPSPSAGDVVRALEAALSCCRGDFLEETLFGDWHLPLREELRRRRLGALLTLGELQLGQERPAEAATAFRQALGEDRLLERAHRGLMLALARQGERDRALAHFRLAESLLHAELGALPSDETRELAERLRSGATV